MKKSLLPVSITVILFSCSVSKKINRLAQKDIFQNTNFINAHTGISIYETGNDHYIFNYQADKYFVPASNTKLFTCYAAMKYLGDSITAIRYHETNDTLFITPQGDPTFLHPDFINQPVYNFLKNSNKTICINTSLFKDERWGMGWSWDDYNSSDAAERSAMPAFGNIVKVDSTLNTLRVVPSYFNNHITVTDSLNKNSFALEVTRDISANNFYISNSAEKNIKTETPFFTGDKEILKNLLEDTLHKKITISNKGDSNNISEKELHSQPLDTMLKILMYRSDNFFAEQSLLMVSNKLLHVMNDDAVIDTLLKTDYAGLPQKPRWVDGSGLSHYNLFTPYDFIFILKKLKDDFGLERISAILPTGGTGTLRNYYKEDSGFIFAKTGSLSGVIALSGYLYTKKKKVLIFSILVNNHLSSPADIRKGIEHFVKDLMKIY